MFRGVSQLNLDAKGRLAIPARYREALAAACGDQMVTTVDPSRCLLLYPFPEWERIEQSLMSRPNMNPKVRNLQRLLVGHATECELDGSGRLLLPAPLRQYARLEKHVILLGQGNKFEIWDQAAWDAQCEQALEGDVDDEALESIAL